MTMNRKKEILKLRPKTFQNLIRKTETNKTQHSYSFMLIDFLQETQASGFSRETPTWECQKYFHLPLTLIKLTQDWRYHRLQLLKWISLRTICFWKCAARNYCQIWSVTIFRMMPSMDIRCGTSSITNLWPISKYLRRLTGQDGHLLTLLMQDSKETQLNLKIQRMRKRWDNLNNVQCPQQTGSELLTTPCVALYMEIYISLDSLLCI